MEHPTDKLRAVLLTALMIGSVFTAGIAFTGTAVAADELTGGVNDSGTVTGATVTPAQVETGETTNGHNFRFTVTNVNGSGDTDTIRVNFPNEFAEGLSYNYADLEFTTDDDLQIDDGENLVDGPDNDGVDDTLAIETSPETDGDVEVVVNMNTDAPAEAGFYDIAASYEENDGTTVSNDAFATVTVGDPTTTTSDPTTTTNPTTSDPGGETYEGRLDFGDNSWDTSTGEGDVSTGATVFQGEDDIQFVDENGNDVSPTSLERTSGADEGVPLAMPIPEDQTTGSYDLNGPAAGDGGLRVTVQTPRVTTLEVQNNAESDVSGGILTTNQDDASVYVEYNYENAEDIELIVENEDGLDVTDEIVDNTDTMNGDGRIDINPNAVDAGDYTFTVEGVDDLDSGSATESVSVTISSSQTASLNLVSEEVVQGENLQYTVENSPEGNFHAVTIDADDFRDGISAANATNIMRNVGDTSETGVVVNGIVYTASDDVSSVDLGDVDYAYAIVEIDGGNGVGSINTQHLDDSSVDVDLYPASGGENVDYVNNNDGLSTDIAAVGGLDTDDDASFDVTQGTVSLDSPTGAYVVGSEATVNGTASAGIDEVSIYARSNNDFQLVEIDGSDTVEVDSDDTFSEDGVVLTADGDEGNDLLSLPGSYRLGIISAEDADIDGNGNVDSTLTTSEFNSGVSSVSSITVTDTELNGSFQTYNGQVAIEDGEVAVEGTAPGKDNLVVAFVDERGQAIAHTISVDNDGTFDNDGLSLGDLNEGTVSAHILSSGRDGTFGEENAGPDTEGDLVDYIEGDETAGIDGWASGSSSGEQVREQILANTVDDTASDDLIVTQEIRLASALTTIQSVDGVEAGGTLTVEGQTNRQPDDNTITVELLDEDGDSVTLTSTEEWGTNGQWSVEMSLANVEPGEYTVESDDGETTDRQDIEIVEEVEETTQQPTTQEPTTQEPTTTEESTTAAPTTTEESAGTTEDTGGESGSGIPGFGMGIALIAVLGAALLALRQN
ncbi:HVO_2072 family ArtA-dependent S-layer glycoprotein [Halobacterium hubeiense]|uniref:HVO_2072 family ArtA-dependent S-layer glycoprotein n=1 Tax=Halobacterium hubeiense TaxID=1407499 RepID=UPI003C766403